MIYRKLGKTGLNVSVIGLGAWQFGGEWGIQYDEKHVTEIINTAYNCGINFIDTAECYGDHLSEQLIGKSISGNRDRWLVATKFGHQFNSMLNRDDRWSVADVEKQLNDSLKALKTDYIDIYQFHSGADAVFFNDDLWRFLNQQKKAGKIRYLGISLGPAEVWMKQIEKASDYYCDIIQMPYSRLDPEADKRAIPACKKNNLGILTRAPLANGFLTGKYRSGVMFKKSDFRSSYDSKFIEERISRVMKIEKEDIPPGINTVQWAIAWCLKNRSVSSVITGCKNIKQLENNARAAGLFNASKISP